MSEERLEKIESKIAFLEDAVEDLNKTIYAQQKQIDQLRAVIESLVSRVRDLSGTVEAFGPADQRPPHY
jgi:SlyX protein